MVQFLIDNWSLVLLAVVSGGMLAWPALQGGGSSISPATAVQWMNKERGVLIDVCDSAEFERMHASGARNLPLADLQEGHAGLPKQKDTPLIVSCASGVRAARAVSKLRQWGYQRVASLQGGNTAWEQANLPVDRKGK